MKCDVLINFLSDYNDHNIVAVFKTKPKKVVFMRLDTKEEEEIFIELKDFLREKMYDIVIEEKIVETDNLAPIKDILLEYKDRNAIVNLSGGSRVQAIYASRVASIHNIKTIIVDMHIKKIFKINNNEITQINEEFVELSVEEIIEFTGKNILLEATKEMDTIINAGVLDFIIENLEIWGSIKNIFTNPKQIARYEDSHLTMSIKWKKIDEVFRKKLNELMNILEKNRLIYVYSNNDYAFNFRFRNTGIKRYFLVSGSWLEALTYKCIKEIKETDDVKSGVVFVWDEEKIIKNEIDVMASWDSTLICISCKDTKNYDEDDLNELDVYAEELGGDDVIKILVSTHEPSKNTVGKRAEEMDIDLIIFDGDIDKFRKDLNMVIKRKVMA